MPNIVFWVVGHSAWQGKIDEIGTSKVLFDIFNNYIRHGI